MTRAAALPLLAILACGACVDRGPGPQPKKIDREYVQKHLVVAPPPDLVRVDVPLGGDKAGAHPKLTYLGNVAVDANEHPIGERVVIAPGQKVTLIHYWRVEQPIGAGWKVFALVRGAPGAPDFLNLDASDMEIGHAPETWKAGEVIADVQDFTLRPDWHSPTATVYVGLIAAGEHQIGDRMAASGPHVVDRAIAARVVEVDLSRAPPPPGTVYVPHAPGPIAIDGVANDQGWTGAVTSPELVPAEGSPEPLGKATARLTWDEQYLYAFISVTDTDVVTPYKNHDDSLWKADDVELFIDADGNRRGYVELQVNPNNATFDSWFAETRAKPGDPTWDSGMVTAVKLRGATSTEPGTGDVGWDAEIAVPWEAVKGRDADMKVRLPPAVGDRWRMNVVRVDIKTGGEKSAAASSWNRIPYSDFHALDRMLTVVFADSTGSVALGAHNFGALNNGGTVPIEGSGSGSAAGSGSGSGSGSATPMLMRAHGSAAAPAPPTR